MQYDRAWKRRQDDGKATVYSYWQERPAKLATEMSLTLEQIPMKQLDGITRKRTEGAGQNYEGIAKKCKLAVSESEEPAK